MMTTRIFYRYVVRRAIPKPAISASRPRFESVLPALENLFNTKPQTDLQPLYSKYPNAESFLHLCKQHQLDEQVLAKAVETLPEVTTFEPTKISNNIQQLFALGFEPVGIATIIENYPRILDYDANDITETFEAWRSGNLHERFLRRLFILHSWLFSVHNGEVKARMKRIFYLMRNKINRVTSLLLNAPTIMLGDWEEVEIKFMYCFKEMRYLEKEISKSTALAHSMSYIKIRHLFLDKVGVYIRPGLKDEAGMNPHKNPSLAEIVDPDDYKFAMNTAKVSPDEYRVFLKLMRYDEEDDIMHDNKNLNRDSEFDDPDGY